VSDDTGVLGARNPLPAVGGVDPEPMERARLLAPRAFRQQERAVTESDYAAVATRRADVGHAAGRIRWTGSWYTAVVTVDRPGGVPLDDQFRKSLLDWLNLYRMAGIDLDLGRPVEVPLDIDLEICVRPDQIAAEVKRAVLEALSPRRREDGSLGFFHPDRWTFGQPVYLSRLYDTVMRVGGISWVNANRFQRLGRAPNLELENGVVPIGTLEIARLDNDPSFEERGRLELRMRGGR
jgi:predicted phage baseplate assembly protein